MSGNICEPTSSATVSGTATTPSSAPAKTRGTFWSTIHNVFAPSVHGTGHVSAFRRIGISLKGARYDTQVEAKCHGCRLAGAGGFEPPHDGIKIRCLTT